MQPTDGPTQTGAGEGPSVPPAAPDPFERPSSRIGPYTLLDKIGVASSA